MTLDEYINIHQQTSSELFWFSVVSYFELMLEFLNKETHQVSIKKEKAVSWFNNYSFQKRINIILKWCILLVSYADDIPRETAERCQSDLQNIFVYLLSTLSLGNSQHLHGQIKCQTLVCVATNYFFFWNTPKNVVLGNFFSLSSHNSKISLLSVILGNML